MSTVVLASAGTGKTWTLVDAWVRSALGLDGDRDDVVNGDGAFVPPERLCAITFTEKAAAEMRSRVEQRLTTLRFMPDEEPALRDDLIARYGAMPSTATLDGLRRAVGRAPIGTFHALCGRLLREHAIAANLDPSFRILEPDEEQRMLVEIAEGVVLDALAASDVNVADLVARLPLRGLFEQRGFVEGLVGLWGSLAERGYDAATLPTARPLVAVPHAIGLAHAAAASLSAAADATGKGSTPSRGKQVALAVTTYLDIVANALSLPPAERIDEVVTTLAVLSRSVAGSWGGAALTEHRRAVVEAVARIGAAVVDDDTVGLGPTIRDLLTEIDQRQRREKEQRGVLGFGDLLIRCRDLLRDNRSVRARVKSRITRLFVDEYQDTSPVQEQLTALLAEDPSRGDGLIAHAPLAAMRIPSGRLFIVGDPKQSIYGFRGADAAVFARAQQAIVDGKGTLQRLTTSRRSTASVCAFVNLVSRSSLPGHGDEDLVPLMPADGAPPAVGRWWRAGPTLKALKLPSVEIEAAIVADRVVTALLVDGHRPADLTILTRRGRSTAVFGRALARRGVPVRVIGGDGFWRRPEILDVVSALSLVVDPRDELAALTVLRSPLVGVADDQILAVFEAIPSDKGGFTWPRIVAGSDDDLVDRAVADRIRAFDALLMSIRAQLATQPLSQAIDKIVDDGGYAVACAAEVDGPQRLRHLEKLRALSAGRPEDGVLGISRLVDAIDDPPAEAVVFDAAVGEDAVRIMTVHQSKGLEGEVVIVADAGIGLRSESDDVAFDADVGLAVSSRGRTSHRAVPKPSTTPELTTMMQRVRRARRHRDECELARLLYVALTRARRGLYVVGEARRGPGSMLGLLEIARAADVETFDALLPTTEVDAIDEHARFRTARVQKAVEPITVTTTTSTVTSPVPRVRASVLHARANPQLAMGLFGDPFGEHEEDIIPPRARGRLAHAVIGLVATELPHVLDDRVMASSAVRRAEEAIGAPPGAIDDQLRERIVTTLVGPLRRLRDEGRRFTIEVPTVLSLDSAVIEGTADLVADNAHNVVVIELKLSAAAARSEAAMTQVQACCAGLEQQGEQRTLRYACWGIGDDEPPAAQLWGKPARRQLATIIAQLAFAPT